MYEPVLDPAVELLGREADDTTHWILTQEGKDFLWGYVDDPRFMTPDGKDLFHNAVDCLGFGSKPKAMPWLMLLLDE